MNVRQGQKMQKTWRVDCKLTIHLAKQTGKSCWFSILNYFLNLKPMHSEKRANKARAARYALF